MNASEAPPAGRQRPGREAVLAAATVVATMLDTAGRLTAALPITIYQIVLAAGLLTLGFSLATGRIRWRRTPIDLPLAVFLVSVPAATLAGSRFGIDVLTLGKIASSVALFFLIVQSVRTRRDLDLVVSAMLVTVGASALYALGARFAGLSGSIVSAGVARTSGTFDDPNIFGAVLVVGLLVGGALWLEDPRWRRPWMLALAVPAAVALLFTFSRGAFVAAAAGGAFLLWRSKRSLGFKAATVTVALVLVVVALATVVPYQFVVQKIAGAADDPSTVVRVYMWRSSLEMARAYPFGVGPGSFPRVYPAFRARGTAWAMVESHNAYLTVLVELGLLGLAAAAWLGWRTSVFLGRELAAPHRPTRPLALGASAALVAIAVQALTYSLEFSKPLWTTLALGVLAFIWARQQGARQPADRTDEEVEEDHARK